MRAIGIWELSLSGGALILAVILLRALALNRLPKGTFLALWTVAAVRLLVPASIPSPLSVYSLARRIPAEAAEPVVRGTEAVRPVLAGAVPGLSAPAGGGGFPLWETVWLAGAAACGVFFLLSYLRCRREYRSALPAAADLTARCRALGRLRRTVSLRRSDRVAAPLTYGVLRPVILLPRDFDPADEERLDYVLAHELVHIRRFDSLTKLILAAAACVHWFNPLAWAMLVLANRDIELRCDEAVVVRFGRDRRSAYAMTLISMEERKSGLGPFASAFSKNVMEERIRAIMRTKKRSLAAILAAVVLVCCVSVAFATSAAEQKPMPRVADGSFTRAELEELAALWLDGWEDMTVAAYQEALWQQRDTPEHYALVDRYGQNRIRAGYFNDPQATEEANAFDDYFRYVCEPLTGDGWRERFFAGIVTAGGQDRRLVSLEYSYTLGVLDRDKLTAGEYWQVHRDIEAGVRALAEDYAAQGLTLEEGIEAHEAAFARLSRALTTSALSVAVEGGILVHSFGESSDGSYGAEDAELHRQSSEQTAREWDELLSPYLPFGLAYSFEDPDLDGNGLTMTYQGREVRGIMDPQVGWITEHSGLSAYGQGAVELYAVYADGALTGLRLATPEEQASFDESRRQSPLGISGLPDQEAREFPRASREDYESLLTLRTEGYEDLSLEAFNQRLLDWANEHSGAWDRINCDVIWNDYGVSLTEEERSFAALTCLLSGTENGRMVRALYTGSPEEDPGFAASLPEILREENGGALVWCDLYYDVSYHIPDRAGTTVGERDRCVSGMLADIAEFWEGADLDALLAMTEEDVAALFNRWAEENSTEKVRFNPVTADNLHFEHMDERGRG